MPQYEWPGWLNIVMVIEQYRLRATATQFAVNRRWRAFGKEPLRLKPSFTQQRFNQISHLRHTQTLGHYARLAAELLKQRLCLVCMFIKIRYHRISHWRFPFYSYPNFCKKLATVRIPLKNCEREYFSFGECRLSSGKPKPINTTGTCRTS